MGQPFLAVLFLISRKLGTDPGLTLNEQLSRFVCVPQPTTPAPIRSVRLRVIPFYPPLTSCQSRVTQHYSLSTTHLSSPQHFPCDQPRRW